MTEETKEISGPMTLNLKKDEIIFTAGETINDLYIIHSGEVLVFVMKGSQITPIAYLGKDEYLGEMGFIDGGTRSASVICTKDTTLVQIPEQELHNQFPNWLITLARHITSKIRASDEAIKAKGIRKKNVKTVAALSTEDQTRYYQIFKKYQEAMA